MPTVKRSFLSDLIGNRTYDEYREYAKPIVALGFCILIVLYALSSFFHLGFISYLVTLTNGYSLLFIAFIAEFILLLDIRVNVEEPERDYWNKTEKYPNPITYKLTIVWAFVLAILGIMAIYFSDKYRDQYSFECDTFFVDKDAGIYHLDIFIDDCEKACEAECLEEMKGYQISKKITFCEDCEEMLEDYGP